MIFLLLAVTVSFQPAAPTVGDPVTVQFQQAVRLDPSPDYEIVRQDGRQVVVRTFKPQPIRLSGVTGDVRFRNLEIPVKSVLAPNDTLTPAPLENPREQAMPRRPLVLVGIATLLAAAAWLAAYRLARRRHSVVVAMPEIPAADRFRTTVLALIDDDRDANRWARLADATRRYLASLTPYLGDDLTTSQLLPRIDSEHYGVVAEILRRGDAEKFSPWGAPPGDFAAVATSALRLIPQPKEEIAA